MRDHSPMQWALEEARDAALRGEVPVGAVLMAADGRLLARAGNETRARHDPTAHAEMLVIREAAAKLGVERLAGTALWVSLEPCAMCAAAISHARINRLYFAADDPKSGGVLHGARVFHHSQCHHKPEIYEGIGAEESASLLRDFFAAKRGPKSPAG